jgi:hypothetical protein
MFRRPVGFIRRPFLVRRRLFGAALVGGIGFAAGRASKQPASPGLNPSPELSAELKNLSDLHTSGALSDEELAAAKRRLLAP